MDIIKNFLTYFGVLPTLLKHLKHLKEKKLKEKSSSNNEQQLEISILSKFDQLIQIESFLGNLSIDLNLSDRLFFRIKMVILEAVNYIILVNQKKDNKIMVVVETIKKQIKVTISCGNKNDTHETLTTLTPLPSHKLDLQVRNENASLHFMKHFPNKISFLNNGTEVVMFFRH